MFRQAKYDYKQYNLRLRQADFDRAFSGLKRALELDPRLADAAAQIAKLFIDKALFGGSAQEALAEAESWARRAIEIDPRCSSGWAEMLRTELFAPHPDRKKALEYALKAVYFDPYSPGIAQCIE